MLVLRQVYAERSMVARWVVPRPRCSATGKALHPSAGVGRWSQLARRANCRCLVGREGLRMPVSGLSGSGISANFVVARADRRSGDDPSDHPPGAAVSAWHLAFRAVSRTPARAGDRPAALLHQRRTEVDGSWRRGAEPREGRWGGK